MVQHQGPKLSKATPHKIHQFSVSLKYSTIKKTTFLKTSINSAPESLKKKICEKIQKFTFFHIYSPLKQGSPNDGPRAKCGPLGLSIRPTETLLKKNIIKRNKLCAESLRYDESQLGRVPYVNFFPNFLLPFQAHCEIYIAEG